MDRNGNRTSWETKFQDKIWEVINENENTVTVGNRLLHKKDFAQNFARLSCIVSEERSWLFAQHGDEESVEISWSRSRIDPDPESIQIDETRWSRSQRERGPGDKRWSSEGPSQMETN